jgi:hypothetical protein
MVYPLINYRNAFRNFSEKLALFKRVMNEHYVVINGITPDTIDGHIRTCNIVVRRLSLLIEEKGLTDEEVRKKDPEAGILKRSGDEYEEDGLPFTDKYTAVDKCLDILQKELSHFIQEEAGNNKEEETQ